MLSYERLNASTTVLSFISEVERISEPWGAGLAITGHLVAAAESILLNLAEACRARSIKQKQTALDYSLGSVLECAACMDIAQVKGLLRNEQCFVRKEELLLIFRQLSSLRNSWRETRLQEDAAVYGEDSGDRSFFYHERLDVYRVAVALMGDLSTSMPVRQLPGNELHRFDETVTSIILNIAEGSGRYVVLDRNRFLLFANRATTKAAALLDVVTARGLLGVDVADTFKPLLRRVDQMTAAMLKA